MNRALLGLLSVPLLAAAAPPAPATRPEAPRKSGTARPNGEDDAAGWSLLDGVAIQADDRAVTFSQVQTFLERQVKGQAVSTQAQRQEQLQKARDAMVLQSLESQAGQSLGVDKAQVDHVVDRSMADLRRDRGLTGFQDYLAEKGENGLTYGEQQTRDLYRELWERKELGEPALGERSTRDDFVRPSALYTAYAVNKDALGQPDQVRFQLLDLLSRAAGGDEACRERAQELRGEAVSGEDFGKLVLANGATLRENLGVTDFYPVPYLTDEDLRNFAQSAEADDISPVLPIHDERGRLVGYRVVRLDARQAGTPAPPFTDRDLQEGLRRRLRGTWQDRRLGEARDDLRSNAYIWTSPLLGSQEPPAPGTGAAESPSAGPQGR